MGFFDSIKKVAKVAIDPLGIGENIIGGVTGKTQAEAAKKATKAQVGAANEAIAEQQRQFDTMLELTAPWREAGVEALGELQNALQAPTEGFNAFTSTPAYTFPLGEGTKALERSAAARGGLLSGRTGKELTRFGQNYASGQYGNYLNRLAGLSGVGQTTASQQGQTALTTGANIGNLLIGAGNARATGYANVGEAKLTPVQLALLAAGTYFGGAPGAAAGAGAGNALRPPMPTAAPGPYNALAPPYNPWPYYGGSV
jgi:hypothetical protein